MQTHSPTNQSEVLVIGAGLAGTEAAWQIASAGVPVHLVEMRQNFTLTIADADVAAHLGVRAGDPLGRLRRSLVDPQGVVAYFSIALIRSDRISLSWAMRRPVPPNSPA